MKSTLLVIAFLFSFIAGCASSSSTDVPAPGHAQCTVCKMNYDLACVDVAVKDNTPRADYQGKTYYFCSDECREKFVKNPSQYAAEH